MKLIHKLLGGETTGAAAINAAEAKRRIDGSHPPFLLDVREQSEYREGHIAGALLLPLGDLRKRLGELPRDREILVICRSGNRSGVAVQQLADDGFNAINLSGGMIGWRQTGLPIVWGK